MKVNALEKIYIDADEDWHRTYTAFTEKAKGNDIEYIRTDAFIEKARKWFEKQNEWTGLDGTRHCDLDEDEFEDFKNYMKNE